MPMPFHPRPLAIRLGLFALAGLAVIVLIDQLLLPLMVHSSGTVNVPDIVGKTEQEALAIMQQHELALVQPREQYSATVPKGRVMSQLPYAGALVREGRRVYVTVSKGVEMATVPNIKGMTLRDARLAMMRAGLTIGTVAYEMSDSMPANTVMSQSMRAGSESAFGTTCAVVISKGPALIAVPSVLALSLQEASSILLASGFALGRIDYRSSGAFAANTVTDQHPPADSLAVPGTLINLTVVR